jgi:hypothetical protein
MRHDFRHFMRLQGAARRNLLKMNGLILHAEQSNPKTENSRLLGQS